jgi:hypothetical protein
MMAYAVFKDSLWTSNKLSPIGYYGGGVNPALLILADFRFSDNVTNTLDRQDSFFFPLVSIFLHLLKDPIIQPVAICVNKAVDIDFFYFGKLDIPRYDYLNKVWLITFAE